MQRIWDMFEREGVATLIAWLTVNGQRDLLRPFWQKMATFGDFITRERDHQSLDPRRSEKLMVAMLNAALGGVLLGHQMTDAFGLAPETSKELATEQLGRLRQAL